MKQQFIEDVAGSFQTYIYENNRKVIPASATLTVYKPGLSNKLIDGVAMIISADGLLSYALTITHNADADENYKAVIAYVIASTTYYLTLFFDVVKSKLSIVITDADLIIELPQIADMGYRVHGTAESGSATTIVDTELSRYADGYFMGGLATNLTNDDTREITNFVSSAGTITIVAATATAAGHKYLLQRSFSKEIQRAFEKLDELLNRAGKRAHLILDPYDLREAHIHYAVAEICKGLSTERDDIWWARWEHYEKRGFSIYNGLNLKYDSSADGYISSAETDTKIIIKRMGRA